MDGHIRGRSRAAVVDLVGTDSHTTMVNGLGVLGWGVGGIEAEAAMLGQPVSMLIPRVVGFKLNGSLPEGTTATDLVLTITQMLRKHGVVGKFVEFYGPGVSAVPVANRATIGNMSPEFGSTAAIFPIDGETVRYLQLTGRPAAQVALVEAYARIQGLWHDPAAPEPSYSEYLELDLSTVVPSIAGPKRPQDRVSLSDAKDAFRSVLPNYATQDDVDVECEDSFPASDAPASNSRANGRPHKPTLATAEDGTYVRADHGSVVIASITSCTNTSNPQVMIGAALLARKAVERGLAAQAVGEDDAGPGLQGGHGLLREGRPRAVPGQARLQPGRLRVHHLHRQLRSAAGRVSAAVSRPTLAVVSVLSGNRNFEGRINPDVKMNYLASPPLVVAYALAGTMDIDLVQRAARRRRGAARVYLPTSGRRRRRSRTSSRRARAEMFTTATRMCSPGTSGGVAADADGRDLRLGRRLDLRPQAAVLRGHAAAADPGGRHHRRPGAGQARRLGDDRPHLAGRLDQGGLPGGRYLTDHGVAARDFNSYGSRRGNHEVMIRGTFANIRLRNQLVPGVEGGFTRNLLTGEQTTIYDAAVAYRPPASRWSSWPARSTAPARRATGRPRAPCCSASARSSPKSYERIHRSNLIGMGVLPLQFPAGQTAESLGLTGEETFDITGVDGAQRRPDAAHGARPHRRRRVRRGGPHRHPR